MTREFASFLHKLWDQIVSPVSRQFIHPDHASGGVPPASSLYCHCTLLVRIENVNRTSPISTFPSYTPTLIALIRARRRDPSNPAPRAKRLVAIGQAAASGETELLSVGIELDIIGRRVSGLAISTRLVGEESCISRVAEELGRSERVHLACHGLPDQKQPFESAFALRDGHFTIQRIIGCDLRNPEFAYLIRRLETKRVRTR